MQNNILRQATGLTQDTNKENFHHETKVLPPKNHIQLHASNLRYQANNHQHPQSEFVRQLPPHRLQKQTIFYNDNFTLNVPTIQDFAMKPDQIARSKAIIHTTVVQDHLSRKRHHPILQAQPPEVSESENQLDRCTSRILALLRAGKSIA